MLKPESEKKFEDIKWYFFATATVATIIEVVNPIIILLTPPDGTHDRVQQDHEINGSFYLRNSLATFSTIVYSIWNVIYTLKVVKEMKLNPTVYSSFIICRVISFSIFIEIMICGRVFVIWTISYAYSDANQIPYLVIFGGYYMVCNLLPFAVFNCLLFQQIRNKSTPIDSLRRETTYSSTGHSSGRKSKVSNQMMYSHSQDYRIKRTDEND